MKKVTGIVLAAAVALVLAPAAFANKHHGKDVKCMMNGKMEMMKSEAMCTKKGGTVEKADSTTSTSTTTPAADTAATGTSTTTTTDTTKK